MTRTNLVTGILEVDGKLLLLFKPKHNDYTCPGGKIKLDESEIDALKREFKEEVGVDIEVIRHIGTYFFHSKERDFSRSVFLVKSVDGKPRICQPDVFSEMTYVDIEDALNLKLAPNIKEAIIDFKMTKL